MNTHCATRFRDEIRRQTNLEGASQVLTECAESLGWGLAGFHLDKDAADLPRGHNGEFIAAMMGWPKECLSGWCKAGLGHQCPIARRCGTAADPFHWSCDSRDARWFGSELLSEHCRVLDHYGRYIADGIAIPVRVGDGRTGYVSWCSRSGDGAERAEATLAATFLVSHAFIYHARSLAADGDDAIDLTARERQCLAWAARGKSEEEIAMVLQRSRDTVHFHLRNAMTKLDARNRTHAVAIACMRGLISLGTL